MASIERPFFAYLDGMRTVTILLPRSNHRCTASVFWLSSGPGSGSLAIKMIEKTDLPDAVKYICELDGELDLGRMYWITDEQGVKTDLQIGAVVRTKEFDEKYFSDAKDFGITYSAEKTAFKLWAPTATEVKLKLEPPEPSKEALLILHMSRGERGVWSAVVHRDLELYRYAFLVCVNRFWHETADPYARAVTANGKQSVVIDLLKTKVKNPVLPPFRYSTDAIIYETHIRDFTIHPNSGAVKKGKYTGAGEANTMGKGGGPTCLSYVKELGITHIEFLPFHDFAGVDEKNAATEYNWGYNPLHFNVPDGSFSSNPDHPYTRIIELKQMIAAIHGEGLRVIMDAVYNHVFIREESPFEKTVPGYFFRHDSFGAPSNGTGVGNDIASERFMCRKYIIDSILFWMKEYHVDGFRFDLMGIFDVGTMNEIRTAVDSVDSSALTIGEGWNLDTPLGAHEKANMKNQANLPLIGHFNDLFRDSIKGSTFNLHDRGYALGNVYYYEAAKQALAGSIRMEGMKTALFNEPFQSVNYVESHDNHTLWDKFTACASGTPEALLRKRHRLATSMVLLAQGIPFIHSGQEFYRTKKGIGNSYRSPDDINWLDWDRREFFQEDVNYLKGIIDVRKSHQAFRFPSADLIRNHMRFLSAQKPLLGYYLHRVGDFGKWESIAVFFNPELSKTVATLPEKGEWNILANENESGAVPCGKWNQNELTIEPCSILILAK